MIRKFLPLLIPHVLIWTALAIWLAFYPGYQSGWEPFGFLLWITLPAMAEPFMSPGYELGFDSSDLYFLKLSLFIYVYLAYVGFIVYKSFRIYYKLGDKNSKAWMVLAFIAFYPFAVVHLFFWIFKFLKML